MEAESRIAPLEEVPDESTLLFRVEPADPDGDGDEREAILVRDPDSASDATVACWLNYCQHLTHIKLDKGSGAAMRNGEIVCENHGAYFEADSGYCTYGPCEGATLSEIEVSVADGDVYLTDDDYAFVGRGPIEDEANASDLTSTSNVEF
ncbi:Rieske (2Fe-2S) protein [Halobiforma nitratireducens]|uniref:Rieske (2Fe-2S) iron-sulfur domain-containing protein n=1 Tax=Halobiforma nitratireducens JCM 10879 TaxID=1227454 RepID=M0MHQ4_9EURY|nr:Rieske 2Fe-2S domain-containing protein [Halobiforma nitratireducens]EMA45262.1 Rieske (2Fe-2S) iron-sulfur domain-containing protein [Halobiforma nitratireducens JCM 10879]